ncbi:hypothetical protein [Nocardia sp. NBC_00565]|uniref:hypothetical protein n=1 Tax=Nocardia sp. NBC_00565 TaxID=2975993 RepID=UPI003FA60FC3
MAGKDIDAADWIDQDLLTRDEAGERLDEEIVRVRARLRDLESGPGDDPAVASSVAMVSRRLAAMESIRNSL